MYGSRDETQDGGEKSGGSYRRSWARVGDDHGEGEEDEHGVDGEDDSKEVEDDEVEKEDEDGGGHILTYRR